MSNPGAGANIGNVVRMSPAHHRAPCTPRGNLSEPVHLIVYFGKWKETKQTQRKPTQTGGEHVKRHTDCKRDRLASA